MVLGGFKQKDRSDTSVIVSDTESILAMCKRLVPSLKVKIVSNIVIIPTLNFQYPYYTNVKCRKDALYTSSERLKK